MTALDDDGVWVVRHWIGGDRLAELSREYDVAVATAGPHEKRVRHTTRVNIHAGAPIRSLHTDPVLTAAAIQLLGPALKLGSFLARTVNPGAAPQRLHRDNEAPGGPEHLLSFIVMIDAFDADNGATRFVRRSHRGEVGDAEPITGDPGTLIVFDGRVLHGHGANTTSRGRRSIQGVFVPGGFTGWGGPASLGRRGEG